MGATEQGERSDSRDALEVPTDLETASAFNRGNEWSILVVAIVLPTVVTYLYFVAFADSAPERQYTVYLLGKCIQFALPVVWVFWKLRQRFSLKKMVPQLGTGGWVASLLMGGCVFVAMLALYRFGLRDQPWFASAIDEVRDKVRSIGCDSKMPFLAMACFYSICHSFLEEYYWRWFVYGRLRNLTSALPANIISSLGFMAHHVIVLAKYFGGMSSMTILFSLCVAIGGSFWAWLYQRTGSIWPSWIGHAIVDAAVFAVGYQMVFSA